MSLSVSEIAREYSPFIYDQIDKIERTFHPSVTEDEELVRRALFAVRNQSVLFQRYIPLKKRLYISVQDVRSTDVMIDFYNKLLVCSCPQEGLCRHKVSVMLSLYQYLDSVQDWATKWREKKNVSLHVLASDRSPESWQAMVDEVMSHILKDNTTMDTYLISTMADNALTKLKKHLPFEREWQPLYNIFMELSVLNKIWEYLSTTNSRVHSDYFEYFFDRRFNSLQDQIQEITAKSRLFAMDPFYNALQLLVRELLTEREGHINRRMNLYLLFWDTMFIERSRAIQELEILENTLADQEDVTGEIIKNMFYIILKNYDAIRTNLKTIYEEHLLLYFGLAKFAVSKNDSIATELLLKAILPYLNKFLNNYLQPGYRQTYVKKVNKLYENLSLTEQEEQTLYSAFGVYGIQPFSMYLLKNKRYEEWAALHQLHPSSISYLESCGLREVLEEAPQTTLPLYHFYAMEEVSQKSRLNYKQAVRIWKMMKSAAKKSGKLGFWADYIQSVSEQYKRLRALQEELEKGNLLV
ncbi:hypothetical protein [Ureibacillus manganicus]|uniref:SWIM-type domain-containing protein n=1 Tax=Ureibacillus manganicus DSM 26584 TaxID=1384049 RepID=A0A0A3I5Y0_9BACL|nr:hypothetical protein [Ureibacillus manganicus]KGR80139.1 hypothetical protein CD29_01925 [Ureibacillus manganicus DSM 26584]